VSPPPREHLGERSKKGTIGRPQQRPTRLPPEHDELMAQHHELDVFGNPAASQASVRTEPGF
jgi:hypothetical protein